MKEKPTAGAVGMSAAEAGRYAVEHADSEDELWQLISRAQERIREMNGKKIKPPTNVGGREVCAAKQA